MARSLPFTLWKNTPTLVFATMIGASMLVLNGEVLTIHPLEKHADAGLRHDDWRFDAGLAPVDNRQLGAPHRHGGWDDGIDLPLGYEHQRSVVRRASRYDRHGHAAQRLGQGIGVRVDE